MSIITEKKQNYNNLHTRLILNCSGDGQDIFEYNLLNLVNAYTRTNKHSYTIEFLLDGLFHTKAGTDFINDILSRFYVSFENDEIHSILTKITKTTKPTVKLKQFQNLKSLGKEVYVPNVHNDDFVFWSIKLWIESRIRQGSDFISYSTIEDYAITHFLDIAKDFGTLKAKCRNLWHWYDARGWKQSIQYEKKPKEEVMATRKENAKLTNEKRRAETEAKIKGAISYLEAKGEKITAKRIAEHTSLNKNTLTKYKYIWKKGN